MKERNSNFEIMRILAMISIIWIHLFGWTDIINKVSEPIKLILYFILALTVVHVNSFVLVSGYYQSKSKFKLSKLISIFLCMWFYNSFFRLIGLKYGWIEYNGISNLIWDLFPLNFKSYWFLNIYMIMYIISPFLNKIILKIDKKTFLKLLLVLFFVLSVLIRLSVGTFYNNLGGYTIANFLFLYLIGGYLRKYPIKFTNEFIHKNRKYIFASIFIFSFLFRYLLGFCGYFMLKTDSSVLQILGNYFAYGFGANYYDDPFVIIQSISFFLYFESLSVKSKIINFISRGVIEAYLIHANIYFRDFEFKIFRLNGNFFNHNIIFYTLLIAVIIFALSVLVFYIRKTLYKIVSKLLSEIKLINNYKEKYSKKITCFDNFINE